MNLTRHTHRAVTPITFDHAHQLVDLDPNWGVLHWLREPLPHDVARRLPEIGVLNAMEAELAAAMVGCSLAEAAQAVAVLIDSYPQRDTTSETYAEQMTMRMANCPSDLLPKAVQILLDEEIKWRPTPGKVADVVARLLTKRGALLRQVQAGQRYREWEAQRAVSQPVTSDQMKHAVATLTAQVVATLDEKLPPRPAHLSEDQLKAARAKLRVRVPAK